MKLEEMTRYITLQYDDFNDLISLSSKRLRSVIQMGQEETCNWSIINEMTFPYGKCPSETTILSESESTGLPSFDRRSGFLNGKRAHERVLGNTATFYVRKRTDTKANT